MNKVYTTANNGNVGIQKERVTTPFDRSPDEKHEAYSVWHDPFQEFEFTSIDGRFFDTEKEAYDYLETRFGVLTEMQE